MKKLAVAVVLVMSYFLSDAQSFRKGQTVEVDVNFSGDGNMKWLMARVIDINLDSKKYVVKASDRKVYSIPFTKEESWIRRPMEKLVSMQLIVNDSLHNCYATVDMVKQLLKQELADEYSEYDSVAVSFNAVDAIEGYKNSDDDFGLVGSMVYPFKVDMMIRLVTVASDGVQKVVNTNVKRKYLVYQNSKGICDVSIAGKTEKLMSKM
jgi:hypothetical protein